MEVCTAACAVALSGSSRAHELGMLKCHRCHRVAPVVSLRPCRRHVARAPRAVTDLDDDEVDERVAAFLNEQDATERGAEVKPELKKVIGDDEVDEEQAKAYCRDIVRVIRTLKDKRDMDIREAKLIIQIDDPRNDEARKMDMEDSAGVSRDEMATALDEVVAGQVPKDRIALRTLHTEMSGWPFLDSDEKSAKYKVLEVPNTGVDFLVLRIISLCWCCSL